MAVQPPVNVIYRLDLEEEIAELVEYLMEYCYTGDVDKLACLSRYQIESIGKWKETTIYSVEVLWGEPLQLDPILMNWRCEQLEMKSV